MTKIACLDSAVDITKEYARSEAQSLSLEQVLEDVYNKLVELSKKDPD